MAHQLPIYPSYLPQGMQYLPGLSNYCLPMNMVGVGGGQGTVQSMMGVQGMYPSYTSYPQSYSTTVCTTPPVLPSQGEEVTTQEGCGARLEPNRDTSVSPRLVCGEVPVEQVEDKEEYLAELGRERDSFQASQAGRGKTRESSHVLRILEREIALVQSGHAGPALDTERRLVDVYREKPVRLTVRVAVPVKEHPKFNFVGKLLGPKGNSLKRLQEETLTKMAVLGKGSMRDKAREEEMRLSKDPKYLHLSEDLHVEITAFAPPAEAHARLSYALTEVRKYLIPDSNDQIRQLQMKELEILSNSEKIISIDPSLNSQFPTHLLRTVSPLQSLQPLLVPSPSYLGAPTLPLLPTPPLDSAPTITAPPTKYEVVEEVVGSDSHTLKMSVREEQGRERRQKTGPY